jgi:integrase
MTLPGKRKEQHMLTISNHDGTLSPSTMQRLEGIKDRSETIRQAARAPRTVDAYRSDWVQVQRWVEGLGYALPDADDLTEPIPVGIIESYLLDRSDPATPDTVTPSTLGRHLAGIRWWHHQAGLVSPTDHPNLADVIAGIRRTEGVAPRRVRPVYLDDLAAMVESLPDGVKGERDRAILLSGWWGAFRRSELAALDVDDLADDPAGLIINLRRSKVDQEGAGRAVPLHYHDEGICPVRAVRTWAAVAGDGALFRQVDRWGNLRGRISGQTVATVVKAAAERIGHDPDTFSGHSLRAGFVSECDRRGISSSAVRIVTGHQSDAMLSVYTRPRSLFESSAGAFFDTEVTT